MSPKRKQRRSQFGSHGLSKHKVEHDLLDRFFLFMRTAVMQEDAPGLSEEAAVKVQDAIEAARPPFVLHFVRDALFRDRQFIPMDLENFRRLQMIQDALENLAVNELEFTDIPKLDEVLAFGRALAEGAQRKSDALHRIRMKHIAVQLLPRATMEGVASVADPHVYAFTELSHALDGAQRLLVGYDYATALSSVRHVERACGVGHAEAAGTLESLKGAWTLPRRAVAACLHGTITMRSLGFDLFEQRAAGHALLTLALHGLTRRGGVRAEQAAPPAMAALGAAAPLTHSGVDPHRLRVAAMLYCLGESVAEGVPRPGLLELMRLLYDMERMRCPEGVEFDLTCADLIAWLVRDAANHADGWRRAVVHALGLVPAGSYVIANGKLGVVVGRGEDPWRPPTLVGGTVVTPIERVRCYSPIAMAVDHPSLAG